MTEIVQTQPGVPAQPAATPQTPTIPRTKPQMPVGGSRQKAFLVGGIIALLVVIVGVLFLLKVLGKPSDKLLATVGNEKIYLSTVQAAAEEQYAKDAVTKDVLKRFEEILIERAVLDEVAQSSSISVTDQDIDTSLKNQYGNNVKITTSPAVRTTTKYLLLKQKVMAKQIKNVEVYTMGYYVTPYDYPQKPEFAQQRIDALAALTDIAQKLQTSENISQIASDMAIKYPSIKDLLSVNGHIFTTTTDPSLIAKPVVVVLSADVIQKHLMTQDLYDALKSIKKGEVKKLAATDGSGGKVIKAISVTDQGYLDYNDLLTAKKKELLTIQGTL